MKMYVVGYQENKGISKKTGKPYHAVILQCVKRNANTHGKAVETIYLDCESALYKNLCGEYSPETLLGSFIDVSRDARGWIEDIQYMETDKDAVAFNW